jgi:hypothetical protein
MAGIASRSLPSPRCDLGPQLGHQLVVGCKVVQGARHLGDRAGTRRQADRRDPIRKTGGAGHGIWTSARPPDDRACRQGERFDELDVVVDPVEERPAGTRIRPSIAWAVDGDESHAGGLSGVLVGAEQPRAGRAVEQDHRHALQVAPFGKREGAAIAELDCPIGLWRRRGVRHKAISRRRAARAQEPSPRERPGCAARAGSQSA